MTSMSIHDVAKKKGPIYAINNTNGKNRSDIYFQVPNGSRTGMILIGIPATWVPIDLTEQTSRKSLLESSEFRKAVGLRYIKLLDDKEAQKIIEQDGAKEEYEKVRNTMRRGSAPDPVPTSDLIQVSNLPIDEESVISTRVEAALLDRDNKEDIAFNNIIRSLGDLSIKEYRYIKKLCADSHPKTAEFCKKKIIEIKKGK